MDLTRVIIGPITTEKSERLKAKDNRVVTLRVSPDATKIDVKSALKRFYDVDALYFSLRVLVNCNRLLVNRRVTPDQQKQGQNRD